MKRIHTYLLVGLVVTLVACKATTDSVTTAPESPTRTLDDIALNGKVYSAVWQQNAGEFRALCYQAYNVAQSQMDQQLMKSHDKPYAIITDVDETFLDNSPYAVTQAQLGNEYDTDTWLDWTSKAAAKAYPGALAFFNYAASQGVTVFYITNRNEQDKPGTVANLKALGFPFADADHVLVKQTTSDKTARRQQVLTDFEVLLYLGDNLGDFPADFYHRSQQERNALTDSLSNQFGTRFIVLPNSGYGNWESALPGYHHGMTPQEKDSIFLKNVKGY